MKRIRRSDYIYAIGRIRALEKFLVGQEVFEEAIGLDLDSTLRLFTESQVYSGELLHVKESTHLEKILDDHLHSLKKVIKGLLLDRDLIRLLEEDSLRVIAGILKGYPSSFLYNYIMHLVDMHNIKSFIRLYVLKEPLRGLEEVLTNEGFIKIKDLLELYTQDMTAFLNRLEYIHRHNDVIDYTYYLREAIQKAQEGVFVSLEREINSFLSQVLKTAKYIMDGPEPILTYYFARLNEISLIRAIILAKLNKLPESLIRERLNIVYA